MKKTPGILLLCMLLFLAGCEKDSTTTKETTPPKTETPPPVESIERKAAPEATDETPFSFDPKSLINIDLDQDLSNKTVGELRILRNALFARQGYLFMKADLRGYYSGTGWYDSLMEARYWAEEEGDTRYPRIQFTAAEQAFIAEAKRLEQEKLAKNFVDKDGLKIPNPQNIVNLNQFEELSPALQKKLSQYGFAILPNENIQHFHVYEKNDYHQVPNFITTDLYLQVVHMYFGYLLRSLEEDKFIPKLTEMSDKLHGLAMKTYQETQNETVKKLSAWATVYYAVPHYIITGKKLPVPESQSANFNQEINNIEAASDETSAYLGYTNNVFFYSLFKPRGHYTRTDGLKNYFKAMMWMQYVPFCLNDDAQLQQASLAAHWLSQDRTIQQAYQSILEPTTFLIGEPDNVSVMDLYDLLPEVAGDVDAATLVGAPVQTQLRKKLVTVARKKNRIRPKVESTCPDKINFMPQRYLADNEIMQKLVLVRMDEPSPRPFPKGLDVLAAFGSSSAEDILLNVHDEAGLGNTDFLPDLRGLQRKFKDFTDWDKSVYNKWIENLVALQEEDEQYPDFMKTKGWQRKNLNTALASWAELKHDAILYAEQPMAAECGGDGPPAPITVGYVEPNVRFWKKAMELLDLTDNLLGKHGLGTDDIKSKSIRMRELCTFLLSASEKELRGEKLSPEEYSTIEIMGSTIEYLTLSIVEPDKYLDSWELVTGPDKSVAVVADVYTNGLDIEKKGILHVGVGNVNDLYVLVEIEGYIYLTKGATFSYYEFVQPMDSRLTDEAWQKMLEEGKTPPIPIWMKEIIVDEKPPKTDERYFYSSGC